MVEQLVALVGCELDAEGACSQQASDVCAARRER
jgi:hypothetical protein